MKTISIDVNYVRFQYLEDIYKVQKFTNAESYKYFSEEERLEIDNKYEKINIWLGGFVLMLHNKPVFLNERQFNAL